MLWLKTGDLTDVYQDGTWEPPIRNKGKDKAKKGLFLLPGHELQSDWGKHKKFRKEAYDQKVLFFQSLWNDKLKEYEFFAEKLRECTRDRDRWECTRDRDQFMVLLSKRRRVHEKTLNLMRHIFKAGLSIDLETNLVH